MRIYQGMYEAVKETERELVEMGIRNHPQTMQDKDVKDDDDYDTIELQGYGYKILSSNDMDEAIQRLGGSLNYCVQEFADRIADKPTNPGKSYLEREEVWKPFLHEGKFSYTYSERIFPQLNQILAELKNRPETRQAVITFYDRHQDLPNLGGKKRIPCSMYYQVLVRNRNNRTMVDLVYTMRSCDIYTHFIYDVWLALKMQKHIANVLGERPGHFTHFIGSLHAYKKDYEEKGVF